LKVQVSSQSYGTDGGPASGWFGPASTGRAFIADQPIHSTAISPRTDSVISAP
jgi:hypothetical protein